MYRIRIFSSFGKSENCKEIFERLCETNKIEDYGDGKKYYITNEDDYTHVIIMNTAMPVIPSHIPKENVIGLAFEPVPYLGLTYEFVDYVKQNVGKYLIGDVGDKSILTKPFIEHYGYMWHMTPLKQFRFKDKRISIMISMKLELKGHIYRHQLVNEILKQDLPIDVYGKGCELYRKGNEIYGLCSELDGIGNNIYHNKKQLKGEFTEIEPYERYEFHIAIENMETNHYFSEKITNTLLCGTVPIYLGCKNIEEYFPGKVIRLNGDIEHDIELLKNILREPEKYKKEIKINEVKEKISLIKNLDMIFA